MNNEQLSNLGAQLLDYCNKFNIPFDYLFEILEDQKVTPMIRGKAMEYNVYLVLEKYLSKASWSVQKLNLNAQTGTSDEDVSVTHRRTGIILKVESKSAVRGSISDGVRTRIHKVPHFKVKSHRSRSNISLAGTSNDRYSVDSFDVIITTSENSMYQGNTVGEHLEIVHKKGVKPFLFDHFGVDNAQDLIKICQADWRFCIPTDIAEDGFIPRTPYVLLTEDPNWRPLDELEKRLLKIVKEKWNKNNQKDRRN